MSLQAHLKMEMVVLENKPWRSLDDENDCGLIKVEENTGYTRDIHTYMANSCQGKVAEVIL